METAVKKKPRLEWLDAMRGFTMILVVANHVSQSGFAQDVKLSSSLSFLILFRMPLFFFISGFLAYKASQVWDIPNLFRLVGKKMRIQIIPTVVPEPVTRLTIIRAASKARIRLCSVFRFMTLSPSDQ